MSAAGPRLLLASGSPQRRAILEQIGVRFEVRVSGVEEVEQGPAIEVALENAYRKAAAVAAGARTNLPILGVDTVVSLGTEIFGKPADAVEAREMIAALAGRRHEVISGLCVFPAGAAGPSSSPGAAGSSTSPGAAGSSTSPGAAGSSTSPGAAGSSTGPGAAGSSTGPGTAGSSTGPGDVRPRTAAARTAVDFRELTGAEIERYVAHGEWEGRAGGYAIQERGATLVRSIEGDYLNVVGLPVATLLDLMPSLLS